MTAKFNDQILVGRSLEGDEEAFGQLYDKYVGPIYRFILIRVSNIDEAKDLTSEVFLKCWQYLANSDKKIDDFRSLIFRIARNLVIDFYRAKKDYLLSLDEQDWDKFADESDSLYESVAQKDERAQTRNALEKIGAENRDLILLRYFDDLSVKEIAALLNKSRGAVRVAIHRARRELKAVLEDIYADDEEPKT